MNFFSLKFLFEGVHLDLDDEVFIYEVNTKDYVSSYQLHEVYKITNQGDPMIRHLGSWSREGKSGTFFDFMKDDKNSRRKDLRVSIY